MIYRKSRRNLKKNKKISRKRYYIGGETCNQYKDIKSCIEHRPKCLWKLNPPSCIDNINYFKPEDDIKRTNTKIPEIKQTNLPSIPFKKMDKKEDLIIVDKKKAPTKCENIKHSKLKTPPMPVKFNPPKLTIVSPKVSNRSSLDVLPLVDPYLSFNERWPLITDVVKVPGDGDCLFHALRLGLNSLGLYDGTSQELRTQIVNQLRILLKNGTNLSVLFSNSGIHTGRSVDQLTFGEYFESLHATGSAELSQQVKTYLDEMAAGKWGTEIEIWMASKMFNVNIDVYTLPRYPGTTRPIPTGKIGNQFVQLLCLNKNEDVSRPTLRIFNASGASEVGMHYDALPPSLSIEQYCEQKK